MSAESSHTLDPKQKFSFFDGMSEKATNLDVHILLFSWYIRKIVITQQQTKRPATRISNLH
jgi:hypothetical protein